jgi:hypothetical protein
MKYKVTYRDCIDESCNFQMIDTIILSDETLKIFLRTHINDILSVEQL